MVTLFSFYQPTSASRLPIGTSAYFGSPLPYRRTSATSLVNYLTYDHIHHRRQTFLRGLKRNSTGTTVKQLRIFLRDRVRRKIIPSLDLADFKIFDEQTDAIYLTIGEIRRKKDSGDLGKTR